MVDQPSASYPATSAIASKRPTAGPDGRAEVLQRVPRGAPAPSRAGRSRGRRRRGGCAVRGRPRRVPAPARRPAPPAPPTRAAPRERHRAGASVLVAPLPGGDLAQRRLAAVQSAGSPRSAGVSAQPRESRRARARARSSPAPAARDRAGQAAREHVVATERARPADGWRRQAAAREGREVAMLVPPRRVQARTPARDAAAEDVRALLPSAPVASTSHVSRCSPPRRAPPRPPRARGRRARGGRPWRRQGRARRWGRPSRRDDPWPRR